MIIKLRKGEEMSYDFTLKNKKTGETLTMPIKYNLYGGTYEIGGTNKCWLNITYNYSKYYYEASENDNRFRLQDGSNGALNALEGISGLDSIPLLNDLINRIRTKYMVDGEWLKHDEIKKVPFDKKSGEEIINWQNNNIDKLKDVNWVNVSTFIDEGETDNYWKATAKNAVTALEGLLFLAKQRPDGVWRID